MPSHLINQSCNIINTLLPFMTTGYMFLLKISRNDYSNNINNILLNNNDKIIITDDISIKSYLLTNIELNNNNNQFGSGYIRYNYDKTDIDKITNKYIKNIENMRKDKIDTNYISKILLKQTLLIMDEFDMMYNPLCSDLNYPLNKNNIPFQNNLIKIILYITKKLFTKYTKYMRYSNRDNIMKNKIIIKKIMLETNDMTDNDEIKLIFVNFYEHIKNKINNYESIEQFNLTKNEENIIKQVGGTKISDSLLTYYLREIYKTYYIALTYMLDKDYGWDNTSICPFIAIPFLAQDTPMNGSKFSNVIINIILTSIAYYQKEFRKIVHFHYRKTTVENLFKIRGKFLSLALVVRSTNSLASKYHYLQKSHFS